MAFRGARDALPSSLSESLPQWRPTILRWCRRLGVGGADAEDVAQDVLLVAFRRQSDLEDPDRLRSWLFGITRRISHQHRMRLMRTRWLADEEIASREDPTADLERRRSASELIGVASQILRELPAPQRAVLTACVLEERTVRETAALLGLPQGTVATRLRIAKRHFHRIARARRIGR